MSTVSIHLTASLKDAWRFRAEDAQGFCLCLNQIEDGYWWPRTMSGHVVVCRSSQEIGGRREYVRYDPGA